MRQVTRHRFEGTINETITIEAVDEPGEGGANHSYRITYLEDGGHLTKTHLNFQKGAVKEVGINGITEECLIAILMDRLACFQEGPFRCNENRAAIGGLQTALEAMRERRRERSARDVEGTMQP